jgi:DNA invertase Pin-like site-specific DNA recombinase
LRIALYARVSTRDKDQDPETQLHRLRQVVAQHVAWTVVGEYTDHASANDLRGRVAWRRLLDDAVKRRFDAVLVFKLDRAFRSVRHMHQTLEVWEPLGIGFLSAQEGFDTTTALGRLLLNLLASLAEFELELIRERVVAGMERAKAQGKAIGRPGRLDDPTFRQVWDQLAPSIADGRLSRREAAQRLGCGEATVRRLLAAQDGG